MRDLKPIFVEELLKMLDNGKSMGFTKVEIRAGDLAHRVGITDSMPSCCNAMRSERKPGDKIGEGRNVHKGNGANVFFMYDLTNR